MNTAIRVALAVAAVVGVVGGGGLMGLIFQGAVACARSGIHATPKEVLESAVFGQAAFVTLAYATLFIGFLFGTQALARRRGFSRRTPGHLVTAAVLASAAAVLAAVPFLFGG